MDYHKICRKVLGRAKYEKLVIQIAKDVKAKFGMDISLERFVKVIEINIRSILIIGISIGINLSVPEIKQKLNIDKTKKYLTIEEYTKFTKKYTEYISIIEKYIKKIDN